MGYAPSQGLVVNPGVYREIDDPEALADTGKVYTNDVTGRTELMYKDDTGAEIQITSAGAVNAGALGTVPIAQGGTGQTTAVAAFDALSPVTTRGDIITRDASNNIRLAVGAAARVLRSDGTDPIWAQVALTTDVTGTLPVANGGTGVTASTGTTNVVLSGSPTIVTPTIASFANAAHDHSDAAGGGNITLTTGVTGTLPVANGGTGVTSSTGTGSVVLSATPTFTGTLNAAAITATGLTTTDTLSVTSTSTFTGVTTHGGDVVSDTDSTDSLGTTTIRWACLFVDDITVTTNIIVGDNVHTSVGAQATPSLSFSVDINTGFYRFAADEIGVTTGADVKWVFGSSANAGTLRPADSNARDLGTTSLEIRSVYIGTSVLFGTDQSVTIAAGSASEIDITQAVVDAAASPIMITVSPAAHTALTVGDFSDVFVDLARTVEWTAGAAITNADGVLITLPTFAGTAGQTITTASTVRITGAPAVGANMTYTNGPFSLLVDAGEVRFAGTLTLGTALAVTEGGTGVTSSTGTGSVVLSATPTFTGTLNAAAITATGLTTTDTLSVTSTSTFTGVTTHGGDVVSDTTSTDSLGTTGVRWLNLFVDAITATTSIDAAASAVVLDTNGIMMGDAKDIITNATTGTVIATATSQKLAFWAATPVVQPGHIADATGGAVVDIEARAVQVLILADLAELGLQAAS